MNYTWQDIEMAVQPYIEEIKSLKDRISTLESENLMKDIEINNLNLQLNMLKALYQNS